ncbi:MAG: hypothetical protein HC841_02040 [Verrucomicrobiae bacterium]|nr:hypothetical protein [Verrucomicrobiae bacterium]
MQHFIWKVIGGKCGVMLFVWTVLAGTPAHGQGTVVFNPANGHYYQTVGVREPSWQAASDAAAALQHEGRQGHLATITSLEENQFVFQHLYAPNFNQAYNVAQSGWAWLGGFLDRDTTAETSSWKWVTGEPFTVAFWDSGQPSGSVSYSGSTPQDYIVMWNAGRWNDASGLYVSGYIVEYSVVPESSTTILLLCGLLVVLPITKLLRYRRRNGEPRLSEC